MSAEGPAFYLRAALEWIDALPKDLSIDTAMPGFDRDAAEQAMNAVLHPRPLSEYHEDYGTVTWFTWTGDEWLGEPSYIGRPDDSDWPGYHTHWTPHPEFPRSAPAHQRKFTGPGHLEETGYIDTKAKENP